ncbi:hypothetical protein V6N13_022006 [Hibiscus sabdariffa]|uniref:Uncharacterized protein n=2 Tax=Hibiscus sabdariffa TaxID=183260 RepID=A0ABR1ZRF2_9ROSI
MKALFLRALVESKAIVLCMITSQWLVVGYSQVLNRLMQHIAAVTVATRHQKTSQEASPLLPIFLDCPESEDQFCNTEQSPHSFHIRFEEDTLPAGQRFREDQRLLDLCLHNTLHR